MPKEYFAKKGKKRSGGGPFLQKDAGYGQGKSPIEMNSPLHNMEAFQAMGNAIGSANAPRTAVVDVSSEIAKYNKPKDKKGDKGGKTNDEEKELVQTDDPDGLTYEYA